LFQLSPEGNEDCDGARAFGHFCAPSKAVRSILATCPVVLSRCNRIAARRLQRRFSFRSGFNNLAESSTRFVIALVIILIALIGIEKINAIKYSPLRAAIELSGHFLSG
jgi:hypothetical protein